MKHYIYLPATGKHIGIRNYINGLKLAKANPEQVFSHTLNSWSSGTGERIIQEYRQSIHHRINEKGNESWRNEVTEKEIQEQQDCQNLHNWLQKKYICRRLYSKRLQKRFGHLLYQEEMEQWN